MRIDHLEISNFRKLLAVRLDLSPSTTLLVGANNSGKTSAMIALRHFLVDHDRFCMNDFTLSHWPKIKANGEAWRSTSLATPPITQNDWTAVAPSLDIWLQVAAGEFHYVSKLMPTLDWAAGLLGVRLRYEPTDLEAFRKDFTASLAQVADTIAEVPRNEDGTPKISVKLWPEDMVEFLERRLRNHFSVRAYLLDPAKLVSPSKDQAHPQSLPEEQEPVEIEHLRSLMRIDEIDAQRGFGRSSDADVREGEPPGRRRLSTQLRSYFAKHLNPSDSPDINDLEALHAIEEAQHAFDQRLESCFKPALGEVQGLGYPGVTDPRITISTRLHPVEGLNHEAAVQYRVDTQTLGGETPILRLPEDFNGLGYQNLISMIFRLMSFRDGWMRVGKAAKQAANANPMPPLHLVLVEEPEAHLHAQVQQVFAKKAYEILRAHPNLKESDRFTTQLVVSTHSIHIAHELDFSCLRYFRRLPAGKVATVPVSTIVNLTEVFGSQDETERFVTRYLKAQHCDLFFADAAILVEGPAERMLVPHFIRRKYKFLNQCYVTLLEIGGSHAHRLKSLIDHLALLTVVITDLDSQDTVGAQAPKRGANQTTNNDTLKKWVPKLRSIDELLDLSSDKKLCDDDGHLFAVRVAYQTPLIVTLVDGGIPAEALPYTFEDALVFENRSFFAGFLGTGLVAKFRTALAEKTTVNELGKAFFDDLRSGNKAEFVLDVISSPNFDTIVVPTYIAESLEWLEGRLRKKQEEVLPSPAVVAEVLATPVEATA
ncbi:MAG: AAA family ATPase [Acidobacteriia bacterium]|nr:AAA family ATPase [Terriglobia bacterium]